jgi:hypothetical protein
MNHLSNLSENKLLYNLVWYTEKEILHYFKEHLKILSSFSKNIKEELITEKEVKMELIKIKSYYNGYNFWNENDTIYNPFSINNLFLSYNYDFFGW